MQLTSLSLALTRAGLGGFSPAALFLYGEQGVWYEPSLTNGTCFQDAAGTTPVTAVEQPVGLILDKSKGLVLGSQLITASWAVAGTGVNESGGVITFLASPTTDAATNTGQVVSGQGYIAEFTVTGYSGSGGVSFMHAGNSIGVVATANGVYRQFFYATSTGALGVRARLATTTAVVSNISVRELPGNHAFQTTTTSRPVLSARYNLLTKTEQFDDAYWAKLGSSVTVNTLTAPDGTQTAEKLIEAASTAEHYVTRAGAEFTAGVNTVSFYAKAGERQWVAIGFNNEPSRIAWFNLATGVVGTTQANVTSASIQPVSGGWYRCTVTSTTTTTQPYPSAMVASANGVKSYTGDGTSGIYIWGASLVPANQASLPYQRVNTSTDYDADPAKFPVYLRFDGIDDWLQTNSIDFTATDKMTVFAGVRKLSDAATAIVAETSATSLTNNGSIALLAPDNPTPSLNAYSFASRGTTRVFAIVSGPPAAPTTNVLTGLGDISGDSAILRVNGTQVASNTGDQGTGNYGNYPLYIGRRGGTILPFNGQIYSLIVRGAQTSTTQIAQTERWVAGKTGVTL